MSSSVSSIVVAALALAACGGDDRSSAPSTTSIAPAAATSAPPSNETETDPPATGAPDSTRSASSPTTAPVESPQQPSRASNWLATVLEQDRGPNGWSVPAGTWTSAAFDSPVTFTTTAELTLVGEYDDLVLFLDPTEPDTTNHLYIARASFFRDGTGPQPIPPSPDEITELIESLEQVDLLATGRTGGSDVPWWDIAVSNFSEGAPYGCELGDACGPIGFTTSRVSIDTLEAETSRIYRTDIEGERIGVYVTGDTTGRDHLLGVADALVGTLGSDQPSDPPPERSFLGVLGISGTSIATGTHVARFPEASVTFHITEDLDGLTIDLSKVNTIWITSPEVGIGIVPADRLIDPAADQTLIRGTTEPVFSYVDPPVESNADFIEWYSAMHGAPTISGTDTIGGLDAIWIDDNDRRRIGNTGPCDPPNQAAPCYTTFSSDGVHWYSQADPATTGRLAFIEDANLIVSMAALDDSTIDDVLARLAPLLESLTIEPTRP